MFKYNKQLIQCHKIIVVKNIINLSHEIILTASSSIVESLDGLFQTFQKSTMLPPSNSVHLVTKFWYSIAVI